MKCIFLNTYYLAFLDHHYHQYPNLNQESYQSQLSSLQSTCFGESNFYSKGLVDAGWESKDFIVNCRPLQEAWANENNIKPNPIDIIIEQVKKENADVIYIHDLSIAYVQLVERLRQHCRFLVGQIACPLSSFTYFQGFDLIISSFPHYVKKLNILGVKCIYQPLAFEPSILNRCKTYVRDIPLSFVGGISSAHQAGTLLLETIAAQTDLSIYGYGSEFIRQESYIAKCHKGSVWGTDMFDVYLRSKVTINRHIDVAENYANNMRLFESTGCGCLLITDYKDNLKDLFIIDKEVVAYRSIDECLDKIKYYIKNPNRALEIARAGQQRTLSSHTYTQRMTYTAYILNYFINLKYK